MIQEMREKLSREVDQLSHELNVLLPQAIAQAVELGDLRENSEYKAALERQQFVQARLGQLRQRLSKLSQIDVSQIPPDKVGLGSLVMVEDENTGERERYSLVFGDSVEFEEGHVSMSSPIGKTLVGRRVGETVVLKLPAMTRKLKIVELKTIHDAA
jgi:transcription elongation factor GreA